MNDYRWGDLAVGMDAQFEVELTSGMMASFAELSGDVNPLHMDQEFAREAGFPGRVAFGMLTASFYSRLVGVYLPGKRALLHGIDAEFRQPAYIGDRLLVSGEVTFLNEAYRRLELKARVRNQAGKVISRATILAGLREP
jgi:3-hydroxybutyryl-CoA dehydratase